MGEGYSHVVCLIDHTLYHTTPAGYPQMLQVKKLYPLGRTVGSGTARAGLSPERLSGALQVDRPEFDSCLSRLSYAVLGELLKSAHL